MDAVPERVGDGGRYVVGRLLGEGGMGAVFEAVDTRLQKRVALKLLAPAFAHNEGVRSRFRREGLIQANLEHPHIVRAIDLIEEPGVLGLVVELVEGQPLDAYLAERSALDAREVQAILEPVFDAIAHAHANGVVHRDLKPGNVMLARDHAGRLQPRVLDFGIAKLIQDGESGEARTRVGSRMGTPGYMSPEQLRGDADLDHRADIYALGVIAYEALTGRAPIEGTTTFEIVERIVRGTPPPPASDLVPGLPRGVDAVLARALAFDRDARFSTVDEMAVAFRVAVVAGPAAASAGAARRPAAATRLEEPGPPPAGGGASGIQGPTRSRNLAAAALAGVVLVGGGLAAWRITADPDPGDPVSRGAAAATGSLHAGADSGAPPIEAPRGASAQVERGAGTAPAERPSVPRAPTGAVRSGAASGARQPARRAPVAPPPPSTTPPAEGAGRDDAQACPCRRRPVYQAAARCSAAPSATTAGHEKAGVAALRRAHKLKNDEPALSRRLGAEAADHLRCVVDARPTNARHWGDYAWALSLAGDRPRAREALERTMKLTEHPNLLAAAFYSRAIMECDDGDARSATASIRSSLQLKTEGAGVAVRRARLAEIEEGCGG